MGQTPEPESVRESSAKVNVTHQRLASGCSAGATSNKLHYLQSVIFISSNNVNQKDIKKVKSGCLISSVVQLTAAAAADTKLNIHKCCQD